MHGVHRAGDPHSRLRPLDALGELMILDTRPGYPMGFFLECRCEGPLDRERLRHALDKVAVRHPNAHSCLVWKGGRPYWKAAAVTPAFLWDPQPEAGNPWRAFDLTVESGLRLVVLPDRTGDSVTWQVVLFGHHAVCDGLAGCELLGEIWSAYAGNPLPTFADTASVAETESEDAVELGEGEKPIAHRLSAVLAEGLRFLHFFPARLNRLGGACAVTASSSPTDGAIHRPPYRLRFFTADQLQQLRSFAADRSVTLNDWILAATMRVFAAWNVDAGGSRRGIRITMPVSLRKIDVRLPAENRIGYAFLDRSVADCRDADALVASLAEATGWIKESGAAGMFLTALKILGKVSGLLWVILRLPVCFSSAVVSNLGNTARSMQVCLPDSPKGQVAGDVVITHLVGIPPVRPRTAASIGIARYGDHLWLSCLADEAKLGQGASERLLAAIHTECLTGLCKT